MTNLYLLGKRYDDTILYVDDVRFNETNTCTKIKQRFGGINNLDDIELKKVIVSYMHRGSKEAYILSDPFTSTRTSFVLTKKSSLISKDDCNLINDNADWLHICYLDDIEDYQNLQSIKVPYSIDFCTNKPREQYFNILSRANVLLDSRERKYLYDNIIIDVPLILHDENGVEIIKMGKTIFTKNNTPVLNLNVNGAGDIFAALFIKNFATYDIFKSASEAMLETTSILIKRKKNE